MSRLGLAGRGMGRPPTLAAFFPPLESRIGVTIAAEADRADTGGVTTPIDSEGKTVAAVSIVAPVPPDGGVALRSAYCLLGPHLVAGAGLFPIFSHLPAHPPDRAHRAATGPGRQQSLTEQGMVQGWLRRGELVMTHTIGHYTLVPSLSCTAVLFFNSAFVQTGRGFV